MSIAFLTLAISTQRAIGWVIAAAVVGAMVLYWIFNWLEGRDEIGSEIELAANRKPQWGDELMETKRLDMSLTSALVVLGIISIAMPLYWLGEPGRHDGAIEFRESQAVKAGGNLYEENCGQCHGSVDGEGGVRSFAIVDDAGNFVQQVDWAAPSLGALMDRFSFEESTYILNYGRQNSPMPAWGIEGGGPMTTQQIENILLYVASEAKSTDDIIEGVEDGLVAAAANKVLIDDQAFAVELARAEHAVADARDADEPDEDAESVLAALQAQHIAARDAVLAEAETNQAVMGELLFNNPAAAGAYGCARCHSSGFSYNADALVVESLAKGKQPRVAEVVPGGGGYGPSIHNGSTLSQFDSVEEQVGFITVGSQEGVKYGNFGQGVGGGQMPAFGVCVGPRDNNERHPIFEYCDDRTGTLTIEQLEAIVVYEREVLK